MEQKYIDYSNKIASNFWNKYKETFLDNSIDLEDLQQEANIRTWQTIEKYKNKVKDEKELKKYIDLGVYWCLCVLRTQAIKKITLGKEEKATMCEIYNFKTDQMEKKLKNLPIYAQLLPLDNFYGLEARTEDISTHIVLEIIKDHLTPFEWNIFYQRVLEDKPFNKIAVQYTPEGVGKIYRRIIAKIQTFLKK